MTDLPDGFVLDDDPGRIDIDIVWRYIDTWSYWGRGRSRDFIAACIARSHRVVGLYHGEIQIGFARVVSDGLTVAYLCDVFVLPAYHGQGLGTALVREAVDGADLAGLKWILHTDDAHDLYRKLGFAEPGHKTMERTL